MSLLATHYLDYPFICEDCGSTEVWKAEQQKWYYEEAKGHIWAVAQRCRSGVAALVRPGALRNPLRVSELRSGLAAAAPGVQYYRFTLRPKRNIMAELYVLAEFPNFIFEPVNSKMISPCFHQPVE